MPNLTSQKVRTKSFSFKGMVNTYKDNDDLDVTELYAAIDARMIKKGRFKTRRGLDRFSTPVGEVEDVSLTSTTGAADASISGTNAVAQKLTVATGGRITKIDVRLKTTATSSGVIIVEVCEDSAGVPGAVIATSSLDASSVTSSYAYHSVYSIDTPAVSATDVVWVVVRTQNANAGEFNISSTSSVSTGLTSVTAGSSWTAQAYGFNVKLYTTPEQPVLGMVRVNRPNGLNYTFFAAGTSLYSVNEGTGVTTEIHSGMSALATNYCFEVVQDAVYWVNGYAQPYKYDFTTVTQDDDCPFNPDIIIEHVGLLFVARNDDSKIAWSGFGEYQEWTSTDFAYMLAPKTPFTMTALAKLNGVLYTFADRNKYQLLGEDNASFSATEASDQRGTFSQKSLTYDDNSIYHASHDGVWQFNGVESRNLAETFLEDYMDIVHKDRIVVEKWGFRLYVFYPSASSAINDSCFVINLNEGKLESRDLNTPIGHAFARKDSTNLFLQASNVIPAVYVAESESNDYHNLGAPLNYELQTAYNHFDTPGQYKRVTMIRPEFASVDGQYSVQLGYALDQDPNATWTDFDLSGNSTRWDSGWLWGDGTRYATQRNVQATSWLIPGTFRRIQRRYQHVAAREPVEFDSEVIALGIERLR